MVAAFTVALTGLALVGAAESVAGRASGPPTAQAEPRGRLGGKAMRTSGGLGVAILVRVPAAYQRASLRSCNGVSQCGLWSLSPVAPYPCPDFDGYLSSAQLSAEEMHLDGPAGQTCLGAQLAL